VITAEGIFVWKGEFTAKLIAENAESAEIFNIEFTAKTHRRERGERRDFL